MADDSRKLFYSIGEVAAVFHVNESTLRFWEKEFPTVIKPKKNAKGTRNYTKEDIENVRLVHFLLKEKGMTLAGARKKLREEKKGMTAQHELTEKLKKIKSELLKLQTELGQPAEEAPEFTEETPISKRMVFAEPGSEMISVESILEEMPAPAFVMEEIPVPDEEHLPAPEPILEDSPFNFSEQEAEFTYELEDPEPHMEAEPIEESTEFDAEKFTAKPAETVVDNGGVEELSEPKDKTEAEQLSEPMKEPEVDDPSEPMKEPEVDDPSEPMEEPEVEQPSKPIEEPIEEQSDEAAARALYEELEPELIYQPKPEPESEPEPEQNLFYEQPEPIEPPTPEPSKDGWSGSLF